LANQPFAGDFDLIYSGIYIAALVVANLLVAWFGPWFSAINAFVLIGLDLSLRDKLHEQWQNDKLILKMGGLIAIASVISYLLNPAAGAIALASFVAFALAMIADTIAYHFLRKKSWMIRSNGSNVAGAAVDSIAFPTIAFGGLMPEIVALQFIAKLMGGGVWSYLLKKGDRHKADPK
jgi:queuosine precursor transporter